MEDTAAQPGGAFAQLLHAGKGHSSAYRLYLDLGRGESQTVASISTMGGQEVISPFIQA